MDDNNQNSNPSSPDLSSQYDEILEKYSQQLTSNTTTPEATPPHSEAVSPIPESQPEPQPEPVLDEQVSLPPVEPEPIQEQISLPPPPSISIDSSVPSFEPTILPPSDDQVPPLIKKPSNFFKILFFISLLIFLGVAGIIAYTIFFAPPPRVDLTIDSTTPTIAVEPSPGGPVCELNDKKYPVGETFTATDGCNTCTCDENLMISCTEKTCPKVSPSESDSSGEVSSKTYSGNGFTFSYPESTKVLGDTKQSTFTLNLDGKIATIHFYKLATDSSLDEVFFKRLSATDPFSVAKYVTVTSEKISGVEFRKYVQDPEYFKQQPGGLNHFLASGKGSVIEFQYAEVSQDFVKELISTLKVN